MTDTPNRPPLWEVMHQGFWKCPKENWRLSSAYMIRALRDWLVPEEDKPNDEFCCPPVSTMLWRQKMDLRALLTAEADRAERGRRRMTDATPAATAIRQAVDAVFAISPAPPTTEDVAAAVLRAAADRIEADSIWCRHVEHAAVRWSAHELRRIATELEGSSDV